jgi:chromosome segregation ATPase
VDWTPKEVYELRATISDMEIRHAATMLHTQSIVDEANELRKQRDRLLEEREQWRLSSVCRIMKRDLEKARIENDWLGERLDKMEMERDGARRSRAKIVKKYEDAVREMHKSTKQRDRLAEALLEIINEDYGGEQAIAHKALAELKGGSDDH